MMWLLGKPWFLFMHNVGKARKLKIEPTNVAGKSVQADTVTFVGVFNGSASIVALEEVHEQITMNGSHYDVFVGSGLIDMYAKFKSQKDALWLLKRMPTQDVVSCNSMPGGYVMHGPGKESFPQFMCYAQRICSRCKRSEPLPSM